MYYIQTTISIDVYEYSICNNFDKILYTYVLCMWRRIEIVEASILHIL